MDKGSKDDLVGEYTREFETQPLSGGLVGENHITAVPNMQKLAAAMEELTSTPVPLKLGDADAGTVTLQIRYNEKLQVDLFENKIRLETELIDETKQARIEERKRCQGTVKIQVVRASDLLAADSKARGQQTATSDPYCNVWVVSSSGKATQVRRGRQSHHHCRRPR